MLKICLSIMFLLCVPFIAEIKYDYETAKKVLLENNREILLSSQTVKDAEGKLTDAESGYFPKISLLGNYNYLSSVPVIQMPAPINRAVQFGANENWLFKATLTQTIFDWGRMFDSPSMFGKNLELAKLDLEQVKTQNIYNLNQVFYSVILAKKVVETNEESLRVSEENMKMAENRLKAGAGSSFDSLRAKVRVSSVRPLVEKSRNSYEAALNSLKNLLGVPLIEKVEITGDFVEAINLEIDNSAALKKAFEQRFEIKKSDKRKEMLVSALAVSVSMDKPLITGNLSYNYQNPYYSQISWVESWNAGVTLTIPLFDGFSTAGKIKQAEAAVASADVAKSAVLSQVEFEVRQAVLNLNETNERIKSQKENVRQAEEYLRIAQSSYTSGVITNYDVMDAHLSLLTAKTAYLQALYDLTVAKAAFLKAIGELK
ncbi:MAG: hypothetical protein A2231_13010 [Candidatus Firestonebacteria bacterium RIFOXYA2_FULL_40_8]|nr:MAG: hypothetical protein A2231_13010 [Candidatus Firestonebacteria bacterium RIFOXYA2_FULL_40_8]